MVLSRALFGLTDLRAAWVHGLTTARFWSSVRVAYSSLTSSSATVLTTRGIGPRSPRAARAAPPTARVRTKSRRSRPSHSGQAGEVVSFIERLLRTGERHADGV